MKILIVAFLSHFVADFLLQSREMGKTKSSVFKVLLAHISIQFAVMTLGLSITVAPSLKYALVFSTLNALVHGVIDWHIWRLYKYSAHIRISDKAQTDALNNTDLSVPFMQIYDKAYQDGVKNWQYWDDHWFYATIGFDQLLHTLTIVLLWGVL